jgi:hypothetical protein
VRLDAQSFMKAKAAGKAIHQLLAEDADLSEGVEAWGHVDEPTHAFATLMMVLRSGLCQRVDVYGQPGVPTQWFRNLGNGHIVTQVRVPVCSLRSVRESGCSWGCPKKARLG